MMNRSYFVRGKVFAIALSLIASGVQLASADGPEVQVVGGLLRGNAAGLVNEFLGIPYAATTAGANRWRAPLPPPAWEGVQDATRFGANCFQEPPHVKPGEGPWDESFFPSGEMSEDCLFLNVWTPAAQHSGLLPILVWIHGGAFQGGSGSTAIYSGSALASHGLVVVTINYRVGVFGFLAHPDLSAEAGSSGNYGLLDQIAALQWVRDNIAAFGGDPRRVTIAGQSAGAFSVHALMSSPAARGLFVQAIAQSGSGMGIDPQPLADAETLGAAVARAANAPSIAELRGMPAAAVAEAARTPGIAPPGPRFRPVVEARVLPDLRSVHNPVPVLTGLNADEASAGGSDWNSSDPATLAELFRRRFGEDAAVIAALYPASDASGSLAAARSMLREQAVASMLFWAENRDPGAPPVYAYLFERTPPGNPFGSYHTAEVPYVFATFDQVKTRYLEPDEKLSALMMAYWVNFVRSGDPNGNGLPPWPRLDETRRILVLGENAGATVALSAEKWEAYRSFQARGGKLSLF